MLQRFAFPTIVALFMICGQPDLLLDFLLVSALLIGFIATGLVVWRGREVLFDTPLQDIGSRRWWTQAN